MHLLRSEYHVGMLAERRRGEHKVFGGTAQTHPEMMLVRIDHWRSPGEIGLNRDHIRRQLESPWLRIMAVGSKRGTSHEFQQQRPMFQRFTERAAQRTESCSVPVIGSERRVRHRKARKSSK